MDNHRMDGFMNRACLILAVLMGLCFAGSRAMAAEVRVPAFTAYLSPDAGGARVSEGSGITRWRDPDQKILWYGQMKRPLELSATVELRLPAGVASKLRLTVAGASREVEVQGAGEAELVRAEFGSFSVARAGYESFMLESLNAADAPAGDIVALVLGGVAEEDCHFNMKPRRNAASVHLFYPTPRDAEIEWFYCEVQAVDDPVTTFYMACGFHRGYFGMQVNSETERRIIFSVWDSGDEGIDRGKVAAEDRVQLVAKGEGVYAGDFGNEGTGGHSHLKYMWKTEEPQRFLLTAEPVDETHTIFAGYWYHPERGEWMLISAMKAPKSGERLRGLHSFSENFRGSTGHLRRKALFRNQWIKLADGTWQELTRARFSHDGTGKADRLDRFMGVEDGAFFLSHGGFVEGFTEYGTEFERPAGGGPPDLGLAGGSLRPAVGEAEAEGL